MKAVVSEKGQVTIPKRLRERMGIRPGVVLEFQEDCGKLVIRKAPNNEYAAAIEAARGLLKEQYPGYTSDQLIEEMRGPVLPDELPDSATQ